MNDGPVEAKGRRGRRGYDETRPKDATAPDKTPRARPAKPEKPEKPPETMPAMRLKMPGFSARCLRLHTGIMAGLWRCCGPGLPWHPRSAGVLPGGKR